MSRRPTILFVDDSDALREAFTSLLEGEGYRVLPAVGAQETMVTLDRAFTPPDLIISDMILPEPGRREFLARLEDMAGTTPILLISGYPREQAERHTGKIAGPDFLPKPFGVQELLDRVAFLMHPSAGKSTDSATGQPPRSRPRRPPRP